MSNPEAALGFWAFAPRAAAGCCSCTAGARGIPVRPLVAVAAIIGAPGLRRRRRAPGRQHSDGPAAATTSATVPRGPARPAQHTQPQPAGWLRPPAAVPAAVLAVVLWPHGRAGLVLRPLITLFGGHSGPQHGPGRPPPAAAPASAKASGGLPAVPGLRAAALWGASTASHSAEGPHHAFPLRGSAAVAGDHCGR
eukprot:COSAG01_NODE_416_length_17299_cov_62.219186_7_plen_195_part_00